MSGTAINPFGTELHREVHLQETSRVGHHAFSQDSYVPQLVTAQANTARDSVAVTCGKLSLTYKELDQRANQLAHYLVSLGLGRDVIVGLYLNRSLAMVVAALAVLKAGGAYLPLDPGYPADRLAFLVKNAQAQIVVTGHCMADSLPVRPQHLVTLDPEGRSTVCQSSEPIIASVKKEHLAYVIYTSGSTGQPKGVEITHGGLLNLVSWHQGAFKVTRQDRASQLSALAFDAAVWEVWPYLTAGASIHLPDGLATNEPEAVRDWLVSQGITIGFLPTPLAERAMALQWPANTKLRIMLTGADTLHHYPPRNLPFRLVNNYGPTECTVVTTSGTILSDERQDQLPSIGRPVDNVQVYILDEARQPVPRGEPGEIYIGGAGLARGYRNRPDLTAERFVPNPFASVLGARLYKTGDLARELSDGQIAFLGRIDDQIKVRGFRIEPAEIVKVMDEHPAVQASTVVGRDLGDGDRSLVAYFVPAASQLPTHTELRNFVSSRIPDYMVPAMFVKIDSLPLNPSGKVDRASLPAPDAANTLHDDSFVAPRTPIEERTASILSVLLGLQQVSVQDNFFLLGGHSLLGTQLIARLRDAFGVELSLLSLFDAPTVAKLSTQIEALLVTKLEAMSEEEAERLLAAEPSAEGKLR